MKDQIERRATITAKILSWSPERLGAFIETLQRQEHVPGRRLMWQDPAVVGLTEEEVISPLPEDQMPPEMRRKIGQYDAIQTFSAWDCPDPAPLTRKAAINYARVFCDRCDLEVADLDGIRYCDNLSLAPLRAAFVEDPQEWFIDEHRNSIADGRSGYADLLLEKLHTPCVYLKYECGTYAIADGWHRTAASLLAGEHHIPAVIVPLPGPHEADPNIEIKGNNP